ncbi:hypothetical protein ACIB24_07510 [Spongisporangium articulatum]|uniref:Right handed beta helix region n=1 Tax=Spongisporangium articulatum TaxID=3362603 RepID=A0ABW8AMR0_9ACTN
MARRTWFPVLTVALVLVALVPVPARAATRTVAAADLADAVRSARPGDTVVVRGGTYTGTVGWGITPGRRDARITVKAAPGARVLIRGTLQLENADYWTVDGIDVTTGAARTQLLVKFDGGTGWRFQNSEVWGSQGVSNVMVTGSARNGLPRDYRISGNCIHDNDARGDAFMNDHGIYLMPGAGSGPGLITRNLIYGIPNGAAVKAAGPNATDGAASRVTITRNTMARVAAGVILGHGTHHVTVSRNLVGSQVVAQRDARWARNYDAAVVGNHVSGVGNAVRSNALWSFERALHATDDSRAIARSGNVRVAPRLTGGYSCDGLRATGATARNYGRWS